MAENIHTTNPAPLPPDILDADAIRSSLGPLAYAFSISLLESCSSTNESLTNMAQAAATSGSVVVCREQTAGRGRRGRTWLSSGEGSLTFSLLWRPPANLQNLSGLSLAVGVGLIRALDELGVSGIQLKWPNDVLFGAEKVAGVLIEASRATPAQGGAQAVIIGVGINLRLPPELARALGGTATDILHAAPELRLTRNVLLAQILIELQAVLLTFEQAGFSAFQSEWQSRCAHIERIVRIGFPDGREQLGRVLGVDQDGALLLDSGAGPVPHACGEISLRPAQP